MSDAIMPMPADEFAALTPAQQMAAIQRMRRELDGTPCRFWVTLGTSSQTHAEIRVQRWERVTVSAESMELAETLREVGIPDNDVFCSLTREIIIPSK
jgi:hypothetical protein